MSEPPVTARLREHLADVTRRLDADQRTSVTKRNEPAAFDVAVLLRLRASLAPDALESMARRLSHRAKRIASPVHGARDVQGVMEHASARPAVVSLALWQLMGTNNAALASHLIQIVRERAELPSLRRPIETNEPTVVDGATQLAWFADRQLADACVWMQNVPPPAGSTLSEIAAAIGSERERARRISMSSLVPFLKRAASLLLHLSTRDLDPLGFPLGTDAQLDMDPSIERRLELVRWARSAGHAVSPRGHVGTLTIPVQSTPHALQLVAAEPGHGACGGIAFLLRMLGPVSAPPLAQAPIMLCLPDDALDERGARFERWLRAAYPHAVDTWRVWS